MKQVQRSHLEHVHHLFEIRGAEPCCLLHSEALKVLNNTEAIDLRFLILQQFLQDETICLQDLEAQGLGMWFSHKAPVLISSIRKPEAQQAGFKMQPPKGD